MNELAAVDALAPARRIQQDGFSALDRLARCEYAIAGDYLNWYLAQCRLTLTARSPTQLLAEQAQLSIQLGEQLHNRIHELTLIGTVRQVQPTHSVPAASTVDVANEPVAAVAAATVNEVAAAGPISPLPAVIATPATLAAASALSGLTSALNRAVLAVPQTPVKTAAAKVSAPVSKIRAARRPSAPPAAKPAAGRSARGRLRAAKGRSAATDGSIPHDGKNKNQK